MTLCGAATLFSITVNPDDDGPPRCPTCAALVRVREKTLSEISTIFRLKPDAAVPVLSGEFARGDGENFGQEGGAR